MDTFSKREQVCIAGIVTAVTPRFTKAGKPMGIVTIEDFNGAGEIVMFDQQWAQYQGMFTVGCSVFVRMKCQERYRGTGQYSLNVYSVEFLRDVADKSMTDITIHLDLDTLSKEEGKTSDNDEEEEAVTAGGSVLDDLATIIKDSPGNTHLTLSVRDSRLSTQPVRMASRLSGVKVNRRLIDFVKQHDCLHMSM